jgi:hypothetical protein
VLHAGPAHLILRNHTFAPEITFADISVALASIEEANVSIAVMQV